MPTTAYVFAKALFIFGSCHAIKVHLLASYDMLIMRHKAEKWLINFKSKVGWYIDITQCFINKVAFIIMVIALIEDICINNLHTQICILYFCMLTRHFIFSFQNKVNHVKICSDDIESSKPHFSKKLCNLRPLKLEERPHHWWPHWFVVLLFREISFAICVTWRGNKLAEKFW